MKVAFTFCCLVLLIGTGLNVYASPIVEWISPLFRFVFLLLDSRFELVAYQVMTIAQDEVFSAQVKIARSFWLDGNFVQADPRGVAIVNTSLVHLWQSFSICLALIFSWPRIQVQQRVIAVFYGLFFTLLSWCLDVPFVLLASLWQMMLDHYAIQTFSFLIYWQQILENGGRLLLGLISAYSAILLATKRLCLASVNGVS